ncbi:hypothetical protein C2W62_16390 [Candidatus Entotheonella serta]|nr:hypothetical protein C2W62_16390 [Candidatus Entotheonella serta]
MLFHINPTMLAKYRETFTPSRAKEAPTDAKRQLDLSLWYRDQLKPLVPQSPEMRALAQLVEHRRRFMDDRVWITNRNRSASIVRGSMGATCFFCYSFSVQLLASSP